MRFFDFSSWQAIVTSVVGLLLFTLVGMGIRLLMMLTIQTRRERQNRQINERLKALIAAYKTLGGSFTGTLAVSPAHLRDLRRAEAESEVAGDAGRAGDAPSEGDAERPGGVASERARRIRDAVEASLADIVLFGTEEQVALAAAAMRDMAAGRPVYVHDLVVSLRNHIREVLDLGQIPESVVIPRQGPTRPTGSGGGRGGDRSGGDGGRGGQRGGGGGGMGGGMGAGMAGGGMMGGAALGLGGGDAGSDRG